MATQPTIFTIEPGTSAQTSAIADTAGADTVDMQKLFPSSYELPLEAGGNAVPRRVMNELFKQILQNIYFKQQGGVYTYDASIDYTAGCLTEYGGDFYKCIRANGPGSTIAAPSNATYWDRLICLSEMNTALDLVTPAGTILDFAGTSAPAGFLLCNGAAVSRTNYARLFSAIGTLYGAGDGSTTFNVPNFVNRFARGESTPGVARSAQLPAMTAASAGAHTHTRGTMEITGYFSAEAAGMKTSGAFYVGSQVAGRNSAPDGSNDSYIQFKASRNWTGATSSAGAHTHTVTNSNGVTIGTTVLPACLSVLKIIKY